MEIFSTDQLNEIMISRPAIMVYFYNEQCAPCKVLRPKVHELVQDEFPKMEFILVNTVNLPEIAGKYGIFSAPTILVMFDQQEVIRESKYISMDVLRSKIQRYYSMYFED